MHVHVYCLELYDGVFLHTSVHITIETVTG